MKKTLIVQPLLFLTVSAHALAGSAYDSCVKEESALKAKEAKDCSGLRYLLNPSACFITQKALREYTSGKCKKTGQSENVDVGVRPLIAEKKVGEIGVTASKPEMAVQRIETEVPQPVLTVDRLKEENARLKAEVSRLKAENDHLRNAGQQSDTFCAEKNTLIE